MFGDRTLVRVDDLPEDGVDAVTALLAAPPGNPVVITAGALKKGGKLTSLAEREPGIAALASFEPSLRDAPRMAADMAAPFGLRLSRDAAIALFEATGGDRGLLRREIEKLSTYLDSSAEHPKSADMAEVGAIVVGAGDGDQYALVAAVAGGRPSEASALLERGTGVPGIVAAARHRAPVDHAARPARRCRWRCQPAFCRRRCPATDLLEGKGRGCR